MWPMPKVMADTTMATVRRPVFLMPLNRKPRKMISSATPTRRKDRTAMTDVMASYRRLTPPHRFPVERTHIGRSQSRALPFWSQRVMPSSFWMPNRRITASMAAEMATRPRSICRLPSPKRPRRGAISTT